MFGEQNFVLKLLSGDSACDDKSCQSCLFMDESAVKLAQAKGSENMAESFKVQTV